MWITVWMRVWNGVDDGVDGCVHGGVGGGGRRVCTGCEHGVSKWGAGCDSDWQCRSAAVLHGGKAGWPSHLTLGGEPSHLRGGVDA